MTTGALRGRRGARGAVLAWGLLALAVLALGYLVLAYLAPGASPAAGAEVRVDPGAGDPVEFGAVGSFELTDQSGRPFGSADLHGKPWALAAIFTTCSGPCPRIVESLRGVAEELRETDVQLVLVSVDPGYDTPEILRSYAGARDLLGSRWHWLTGDEAEIYELVRSGFSLGVGREDDAPRGMHVTHATQIVAVDRGGRIRGWYSGTRPEGAVALTERLRHLAREEAP